MKSKQLPDDLCDWLKAQTLVIGAVTSLEPSSREPVHRATAQGEETVSAAISKSDGTRKWIKLVPLLESAVRGLLCLAMSKNH